MVKTEWLDFSLSWLKGNFRKSIKILMFLSPLPHVPPTFHKTNLLHNDLKKDAINEFGIKYWTFYPVRFKFQEHGSSFYVIIGEKNTDLKRLTRATKTSPFDRNWATSLKPRRKSHPLCLVWWALMKVCVGMKNLVFYSGYKVATLFLNLNSII